MGIMRVMGDMGIMKVMGDMGNASFPSTPISSH
jgi:hypothetical protein